MVVKVFCGEEFEYKHEWNQLKELYNVIYKKYANTDEIVYILSNFNLAKVQIDVFILTEKGTAILELKSYGGKIIGGENGDWKVIKNGTQKSLHKNLFSQLKFQKFDLMNKLIKIRTENFKHIEEGKLGLIQCWGYFEKGSSYDITQIGESAHIWFDVITADNLIEKIRWINAHYKLKMSDMDVIVRELNLKEYTVGEINPVEDQFELNYKKEISVFIQPNNWNVIIRKISESNILTIVGEPRVGKSTAIINVVNKLKNEGFVVKDEKSLIELFNSRDYKKSRFFSQLLNDRNVFIIDDVFGAIEYNPALVNKWVPLIIKILKFPNGNSKFIFSSRIDIFKKFQRSNNELIYEGLKDEFNDCIVKLNFSIYDSGLLKEILDRNLEYIQLNEDKKVIVIDNTEKIINELVLPGEIWHFLENAKYDEFQEDSINKSIDKAKKQVIFIKEEIKSLDEYEKWFLYILFVNPDFEVGDLKEIYSRLLPSEPYTTDYFNVCTKKCSRFIRIKNETDLYREFIIGDRTLLWAEEIKKLEFNHPIYIEAIDKLIVEDEEERHVLEYIINKLNDLIRFGSITSWKYDSIRYDNLRYNLFSLISNYYGYFNIITKDLMIDFSDDLSFSIHDMNYSPVPNTTHNYKLWTPICPSVAYLVKLFYNYEKFDDELKGSISRLFKKKDAHKSIAYCFAYILNTKLIEIFQNKLEELSTADDEVKSLVAKCIIKNYEYLNENNKQLLFKMGIQKNILIQLLIHNYEKMSNELKDDLVIQIESVNKQELVETGKTFLINYSFLPLEIKNKYDFMFQLNDESVIKQIGSAFETWFNASFTYDQKHEDIDEMVLDLYCKWLTDETIDLNYHEEILYFLYGEFEQLGFLSDSFLLYHNFKIFKPNSTYSKLKEALETNMIILLNYSVLSPEIKAAVYSTAFNFISWSDNQELIEKVGDIQFENDDIKLSFLEHCLEDVNEWDSQRDGKENPNKIRLFQIKIISKLSLQNPLEIENKAKYLLKNYKMGIIKRKVNK